MQILKGAVGRQNGQGTRIERYGISGQEVHITESNGILKYLKDLIEENLNMPTKRRKIGIVKSKENRRLDCVQLKRKSRREIVFKWQKGKQVKIG